jgi:hypothetical protein
MTACGTADDTIMEMNMNRNRIITVEAGACYIDDVAELEISGGAR